MVYSVGIDVHKGRHRAYCLDEKAQVCDTQLSDDSRGIDSPG